MRKTTIVAKVKEAPDYKCGFCREPLKHRIFEAKFPGDRDKGRYCSLGCLGSTIDESIDINKGIVTLTIEREGEE